MPKKLLNGRELAGYIQERQAKQVRGLKQTHGVAPKLAIVQTKDDPVINTYVRLKRRYGDDIGIAVEQYFVSQNEVAQLIAELNADDTVHGIIVQLPLADIDKTDETLQMVAAEKDVDALGSQQYFEPATPMAIMWLLAGYNIELRGKEILLIGRGKLVGAPLEQLLTAQGHNVRVIERGQKILDPTSSASWQTTKGIGASSISADVIITATGSPAILFSDMIKPGAVVVDAGVASEDGKTVGDVADEVYQRDDIIITPQKGGVGPLTVCALFENVIRASQRQVQ